MSNSFRDRYKSYPTPTLVVIASSDPFEYKIEAIEAAREELLTRGEDWQDEKVVAEAREAVGDLDTGEINNRRQMSLTEFGPIRSLLRFFDPAVWRKIMKPAASLPNASPPKIDGAKIPDNISYRNIRTFSQRIFISIILCLTMLAAVWLHGILNRYEVVPRSADSIIIAVRYDRITGRVWLIGGDGLHEISEKK